MRINDAKLKEYIEDEGILEFDTVEEYLAFVNEERFYNWADIYPHDFTNLEETKQLAVEYQLEHNGKVYWILFDDCLDVYEEDGNK